MLWPTKTVEDIASPKKSALATGPFGSSIGSKTFREHGVPLIRGGNLSADIGQRLNDDNLVFIDEDLASKFSRSEALPGDLVFTCWGTINQVGFVNERSKYNRYIVSNKQMKVTPDPEKVVPLFLYYFFSSPLGQRQIEMNAIGSSVPGFNLTKLRQIHVPVPELAVQRAIVDTVSAFDDKIELSRRTNETLEAIAQAIFRDWFVDFGPTRRKMEGATDPVVILGGLTPNLEKAATLAARFPATLANNGLPERWEERAVNDDFEVVMGQSPPGSTYNEDGEGLPFFQGRRDFQFRFPEKRVYCTSPTRIAETDWTLVSVRAPVGDINRAWERCCIGRGVGALMHKRGLASLTYHVGLHLKDELATYDKDGTVFGSINQNQLKGIKLKATNSDAAIAFDEIVKPLDDLVRSQTEESRTLAATRDLLLPKLMSGEIHLRDAEAVG